MKKEVTLSVRKDGKTFELIISLYENKNFSFIKFKNEENTKHFFKKLGVAIDSISVTVDSNP